MDSSSSLMQKLSSIIPFFSSNRYKGQNGKIAVIGGCFEYTGAPYYSALSALKGGCDLSHIFCTYDAGIPLKAFSPELIIHPTLLDENNLKRITQNSSIALQEEEIKQSIELTTKWFSSFHSFVIGPGLGRDPILGRLLPELVNEIKDNQVCICDADFLWYLLNDNKLEDIVKSKSQQFVITPNIVEFNRLWDKFCIDEKRTLPAEIQNQILQLSSTKDKFFFDLPLDSPLARDPSLLSTKFNNLNILQKGQFDIITNGKKCYAINSKGSLKRCGGQGDILAGLLGVYTYWSQSQKKMDDYVLVGCVMGSLVTREAAKLAFEKETISLITPKILDYIGQAFNNIFGEKSYYQKSV